MERSNVLKINKKPTTYLSHRDKTLEKFSATKSTGSFKTNKNKLALLNDF